MSVWLASAPAAAFLRWILLGATTLVIGTVAFGWCVRQAPAAAGRARLHVVVRWAAVAAVVASLGRLAQQALGLAPEPAMAPAMVPILLGLPWGMAWVTQTTCCLLVAAWPGVLDGRDGRSPAGLVIAGALSVVPAFQGHAFGSPELPLVAVAADAVHVLSAGAWIGMLVVALLSVLPDADPGRARATIEAFSPWALASATVLSATGAFGSWLHVRQPARLVGTAYGVTLLLKVALVAAVAGLGARNWKRLSPGMHDRAGVARLAAAARLEVLAALLVLLVTAVLVATPLPDE